MDPNGFPKTLDLNIALSLHAVREEGDTVVVQYVAPGVDGFFETHLKASELGERARADVLASCRRAWATDIMVIVRKALSARDAQDVKS